MDGLSEMAEVPCFSHPGVLLHHPELHERFLF